MSPSNETNNANTNEWECLGPIADGGTIFGLAVSPTADVSRYWAATGCGIFASDDGGNTWAQNLAGLTTPLISALTVAANGALFAGALNGDLFASFDYGRKWESGMVPEELRATVTFVLASPNFRKDGTAFAATDGGGLLVTRDSGGTWEDSSFGLGDASVLALATSPDWSSQEIMFAATLEGVCVSRNGGRAWRETELMMDEEIIDVLAVSPDFAHDRTAYAGTERGSIYRTTDGGRTWDATPERLGDEPVNCLWLAPDFARSGRVVAGVGSRICVSTDRGDSWRSVVEMPGSILCLAGDEAVLLAGMHDAGVWKSVDGGDTWVSSSGGLSARGFAQLISSDESFYSMGPQEGLWSSSGEITSWSSFSELMSYIPLSALAVPSPANLFVVSQDRGILRSTDDGASWRVVCETPNIQAIMILEPERRGWAGTVKGQLLTSEDGGETWREAKTPCEGQEILSIVSSPAYAQDHTLFMGTSIPATGNKQARTALWRSKDGGNSWQQLTTQVTSARWVNIALPQGVMENVADQAVLATGPYCLRPLRRAKDVWISTQVDPNGANTLSLVALGEVDQGGVFYAATGSGIFRSLDGGRTWHTFSEGVTGTQSFISIVATRQEAGDTLYALSLGGLMWRRELS